MARQNTMERRLGRTRRSDARHRICSSDALGGVFRFRGSSSNRKPGSPDRSRNLAPAVNNHSPAFPTADRADTLRLGQLAHFRAATWMLTRTGEVRTNSGAPGFRFELRSAKARQLRTLLARARFMFDVGVHQTRTSSEKIIIPKKNKKNFLLRLLLNVLVVL